MNIEELNIKYTALRPEERVKELYKDFSKILFTSSFGTTSAILIHLFSKINPAQKIFFLDTTYHFAETIQYKDQLTELFHLNVETVLPEDWKNSFTREDQTWSKDPDLCCSINKVEPLDKIKPGYGIWVSGLMQSQNSYRKKMNIFEEKEGIIKFYPIIDMTSEQASDYIKQNSLPAHPLLAHGFASVGCIHCTVKGRGREGRWVNRNKTECGLHL
ncbi:MAG TPA: phosphoadenylyl-sulfate reductase [Bacteroidia bacterium]|jgi:phosphoadenosine phosphosulfate reductase|nr:phosphoadenylyl-sulfate reductase [Bacteroidia bacterium]